VHAVISLLLQSRKFWWYLLLTSSMLLHNVIMTSYWCQHYAECHCLVTTLCSNKTVHRYTVPGTCNSWTAAKRQMFLSPTCGLQTTRISLLWITRSGLWCSIMSTTDKSIAWMNWNGGSSMSCAVLNSLFLTRLLTSGEEDIEHVSMLKEDISSAAYELTMLTLYIYSMWLVWLLHL